MECSAIKIGVIKKIYLELFNVIKIDVIKKLYLELSTMQETKKILKQVKKVEIKTKHLVDGLISGNYHSIFKGQGIEFSEIRDYTAGDDIRSIDWNVTARFNHPFVKEFIEERDLNVYFVFDTSSSGEFGNIVSKKDKAIELTATLIFSALRNNDNIGMFLVTDKIEKFIPAKKGKKHALQIISNLISFKPESKTTDLGESLKHISKIIKRRSVIFIVSDFISPEFLTPLKFMRNKHDIIAINVLDYRELEFPDIGLIELEDEETGEQILVDTSDSKFRNAYVKELELQQNKLSNNFKKLKIDMVTINTDEPYEIPLKKFFSIRKKRMIRV